MRGLMKIGNRGPTASTYRMKIRNRGYKKGKTYREKETKAIGHDGACTRSHTRTRRNDEKYRKRGRKPHENRGIKKKRHDTIHYTKNKKRYEFEVRYCFCCEVELDATSKYRLKREYFVYRFCSRTCAKLVWNSNIFK